MASVEPSALSQPREPIPLEVTPIEVKRVSRVGRYELYGAMARGGMATVHFGRLCGAEGFVKMVAIKRLHPEYARDPEFVRSFKHEARLTSRIRHPNVVSTLDVLAEDGQMFVVMEYIDGESLSTLLRSGLKVGEESTRVSGQSGETPPRSRNRNARNARPPIPLPVACAIVRDVLHGLHAAHEAKDERARPLDIVHRDVSPQNVLVGVDGSARVLDFGIAKAADDAQNTQQGTIKGKVAYMSPEQIFGEDLDRRCDIYAAGVILWELLTGSRLFGGQGRHALGRALSEPVDPPGLLCNAVPEDLDDVVMRALERDRESRFATAMEMATALSAAAEVAPRLDVARWVEEAGGQLLEWRGSILSTIEALPVSADEEEISVEVPRTDPRAKKRNVVIASAVAATLLTGAVVGISLEDDPITVRAGSLDVRPVLMAAPPTPPAPTAPAVTPSATPAPSPPRLGPPVATPKKEAKAPAADCDPPYIIDERGHKKYKRECF
jgi:serine/threonine-protein kinase